MRSHWMLTAAILLAAVGCARMSGTGGTGGSEAEGGTSNNYALAAVGGSATASGSTDNHEPHTLTNGIIDGSAWNQGEGWEVTFSHERPTQNRGRTQTADRMSYGAAWVEVRFAQPRPVNRVVIHALNNASFPFGGYDEAELDVAQPNNPQFPWLTVARITNGKASIPGRGTVNTGPKTTLRFNQVETPAIRFIVYRMQDAKSGQRTTQSTSEDMVVRLLEIEAFGTQAVDKVDVAAAPRSDSESDMDAPMSATAQRGRARTREEAIADASNDTEGMVGQNAPETALTTVTGEAVTLANYRGKVVVLNFCAAGVPESDTMTETLTQVHTEMVRQGVVVVGVVANNLQKGALDEYVAGKGIKYPVGMANPKILAAYGGVPTLPATFLISRQGEIVGQFTGPREKAALKRSISRILNE